MRRLFLALTSITVVAGATPAISADPDCAAPGGWAASMVFVRLRNAGIVDNYDVDFTKTKVARIAPQQIGKDRYRQVHRVTYFRRTGETIEAITVNDASHAECSETGVEIFVVGQHFSADQ
jgi:hypothetical protein